MFSHIHCRKVAKQIKGRLVTAEPITAVVANGHKVITKLEYVGTKWCVQNHYFTY